MRARHFHFKRLKINVYVVDGLNFFYICFGV